MRTKSMNFSRAIIGWLAALALAIGSFLFGCTGGLDPEDKTESLEAQVLRRQMPAPGPNPVPAPLVLPDLLVASFVLTSPPIFHCGPQTGTLTAIETNAGNGDAPSYYIHVQQSNPGCPTQWKSMASILRRPLPAGTTRATGPLSFSFYNGPRDCIPGTGSITLRLFIDGWNIMCNPATTTTGLVAESNEANNASNVVVHPAACP